MSPRAPRKTDRSSPNGAGTGDLLPESATETRRLDAAISKTAKRQKCAERDRCYENRAPRQNEKKNNATDQSSPRDPAGREALLVSQTDRGEIRCAIPKQSQDIRDVQHWPKIEKQRDDSSPETKPQHC